MRCFTLIEHTGNGGIAAADAELIQRFRSGDEESFEMLASRYLGLISSVASGYRGASADIDDVDLVQEGLIALLYACKTYDPLRGMSFKNYLVVCARHNFMTLRRKTGKKSSVPSENIVSIDEEDDVSVDLTSVSPTELVESKEHIDQLHQIMKERLSDLEYKVAVLHISGYSYKEIADKLSISVKKVDNAHTRIRQKLSR